MIKFQHLLLLMGQRPLKKYTFIFKKESKPKNKQ